MARSKRIDRSTGSQGQDGDEGDHHGYNLDCPKMCSTIALRFLNRPRLIGAFCLSLCRSIAP